MRQTLPPRACNVCGSLYQPVRTSSQYCSAKCRKRAQRNGQAQVREGTDRPPAPASTARPRAVGSTAAALLLELRAVNRENSALGQSALLAAQRVDAGATTESGSAFAALNRDFRAARAAALEATGEAADVLDEIARKRQERLAAAGR